MVIKIKLKIILLLAFVFILANIVVYVVSELNAQQRIQIALKNNLNDLEVHHKILLHYQRITADTTSESILAMSEIVDILSQTITASKEQKSILRTKLYNLLKNKYEILKKKGIAQYHFVLPNNETFLRMSHPDKFGDDLINFREDFEYVNKTQLYTSGFTKGLVSHGFRNTYPIFNKDGIYLGAVGVSFSSENYQKHIVGIIKTHTHFIIDKDIVNIKTQEKNDSQITYTPSCEHKDYILEMSNLYHSKELCINDNKIKLKNLKNEINKGIKKGDKFAIYRVYSNGSDIIAFYPIKNLTNTKTLAWFVSYKKSDFIYTTLFIIERIRVVLFFILLFLFYFIYRVLNQKDILNKLVDKKTFELKNLNENLEQTIIEEVEKNSKQQLQLMEQSKKAQMGEMIENIAHQWRQPLSVMSTVTTGMQMQKEYNILTDEIFNESCTKINSSIEFLSETIDTFRNFLKEKKELKEIILQEDIYRVLNIVDTTLKNNQIKLKNNLDSISPIKITMVTGELSQVIINIINNAKDILLEKKIKDPVVKLKLIQEKHKVIITIEDNAGGIPENIIHKIFDPYFTT
ncbi:MAG: hypothetical protein KAJ49_06580, partial [Arcobacteraceae bacterium]|nr:hypothetical protein [Arcobacteraceae bacterium]